MQLKSILTVAVALPMILLTGCDKNETTANLPELPDYSAHITLGDYSNLTYTIDGDYTITDEDVNLVIEDTLSTFVELTEITDRGAQLGDTVQIKYVGKIDGVAFSGGSTSDTGVSIILGNANYIDDFEEQLVGMKTGESASINVTFPENYGKASLNGKDAVFDVTMMKISTRSLPELTDEFVSTNTGFENVEALKQSAREYLESQASAARDAEMYDDIIAQIINNSTYNSYPDGKIDELVNATVSNIEQYASIYGMDVNEYISDNYNFDNLTALKAQLRIDAELYMKIRMALCELAKANNISATIEEFNDYKKTFADENGFMNVEDLNRYYTESDLYLDCLLPKVEAWFAETATEVPKSNE
ncbi:trigger factor [bacterium]|nr:trigger factor [bacterium]